MEADAESEEDENNETATGNNEQTTDNVTNNEEESSKKTPVDKMWAEMDNDNDLEIGNLIDDGDDNKEHNAELEKASPVNAEVSHTPQMNKSPRGRGYSRGRGGGGGPRARRSRR